MNIHLLHRPVQEYIREHLHADIAGLVLRGSPFENVTTAELAGQIQAARKAEKKLPTWFNTPDIYYPAVLSIEQTSSEVTARYKANLVSGKHMVDITGGLGVDDHYFAKRFDTVVHCELHGELSAIARHNFKVMGDKNISCYSGDGLGYVTGLEHTDLIYADPARRDDAKGKVFLLSDCTPNIIAHQDELLKRTATIMVKTSPLLDLSAGLSELKRVKEIHIVAVKNEVKELLWLLNKDATSDGVQVTAVNLNESGAEHPGFSFNLAAASGKKAVTGPVGKYLYEPNAAIMKSGAFDLIAVQFGLLKLQQHTHLYTGDELIDFPGRRFVVTEVLDYNNKVIRKKLGRTKSHVTTRNFPVSVAELRKKFQILDGGERYTFFCTGSDQQKQVILTEKA